MSLLGILDFSILNMDLGIETFIPKLGHLQATSLCICVCEVEPGIIQLGIVLDQIFCQDRHLCYLTQFVDNTLPFSNKIEIVCEFLGVFNQWMTGTGERSIFHAISAHNL